jgi:hypothetical protein
MRSTKASNAVARLNRRDSSFRYSLGMTGSGLFFLLRTAPGAAAEKIGDDLPLEEFVQFVDQTGPQAKVKVSRHDAAFEKQLRK